MSVVDPLTKLNGKFIVEQRLHKGRSPSRKSSKAEIHSRHIDYPAESNASDTDHDGTNDLKNKFPNMWLKPL